jgi:NitT/TauT family transport system substrate-binding protein
MVSKKPRVAALAHTVLLVLLVLSGTTGCTAISGSSGAAGIPVLPRVAGLEKTTINAAISPVVDSAGFFIALRDGLFAQEGLTVNYTPAHGDTVIGGAVKGQYDVIATNYVSYIQAQASHTADLRVIAEASLLTPGSRVIMTLPSSPIRTLGELRGHLLGVSPDANIGFLLTASFLTSNGIALNKNPHSGIVTSEVSFPTFSMPFPDASPVLVDGQVNAAVLSEPYITEAEEHHGAATLADLDSGATEQFPMEGYAVTKAWAQANPNTLKAFLTALEAGQQLADTNRVAIENAFAALPQGKGHIDKTTASLMAVNIYPLGVDERRLQRVADVMQQFGFLSKKFSIRELLS